MDFLHHLLSRQYHAYVAVTTTVTAAVASITDAGPTKRYCVCVPDGTYNDEAVVCKDYVDIIGQSRAGVILNSALQTNDTIFVNGAETMIANMTVNHTTNIGQTRKYPIHADALGATRNANLVLYNVAANMLGTYVPISTDTHGAIGCGIFGTQRMYFVDVIANGGNLPGIWIHNDPSESAPAGVYLINCTAISDDLQGFRWGNTGSGQSDLIVVVGGTYSGADGDIVVENISGGAGEVFIYVDPDTIGNVTIDAGTRLNTLPVIPLTLGFVNGPVVLNGPVVFGSNDSNISLLELNAAANTYRGFLIKEAGVSKWRVNTAIDGTCDLEIARYINGSVVGKPIRIALSTGNVAIQNDLTIGGALQPRTVNDAGMDATAGKLPEIVFNQADGKYYGTIAAGNPATWAALN